MDGGIHEWNARSSRYPFPSNSPSRITCQLRIPKPIHNLPIPYKLFDPTDSHPARKVNNLLLLLTRYVHVIDYSHALLRVGKLLMVPDQMLLVPRILLHALIVFDALEDDLAEAIEVGDVAHLRIEKLRHHGTRGFLIVDLYR